MLFSSQHKVYTEQNTEHKYADKYVPKCVLDRDSVIFQPIILLFCL